MVPMVKAPWMTKYPPSPYTRAVPTALISPMIAMKTEPIIARWTPRSRTCAAR